MLEVLKRWILPRERGIYFCPECGWPLTPRDLQEGIAFDCPGCDSALRCDFGPWEKYVRQVVMLGIMSYYAWKHGWDGGFVIFLLGFYGCLGLCIYMFFVVPLLPLKVISVAGPVSKTYLDTKPLSKKKYESQSKSIRPIGLP